jgi:hypothetical protein
LLLPVVGVVADFAIDGIEILAGPLLVATLALPYLAPRDLVEQIRAEGDGHVYQACQSTSRKSKLIENGLRKRPVFLRPNFQKKRPKTPFSSNVPL